MQKKNAQHLSEVLSDFLDSHSGLKEKLAEHRVINGWSELLGEGVSKYTRSVYFKHNTLYVRLASSVLRAELQMNKKELMAKLNEHAGMPVIRDIVLR